MRALARIAQALYLLAQIILEVRRERKQEREQDEHELLQGDPALWWHRRFGARPDSMRSAASATEASEPDPPEPEHKQ